MDALTPRLHEIFSEAPEVEALLAAHHAQMRAQSPEESCHVMTGEDLRAGGARVFALMQRDGAVLAVGALQIVQDGAEPAKLSRRSPVFELKSMHVAAVRRGQGLGHMLLSAILGEARKSGAAGACLETGSAPGFAAARALYLSQGFETCPPFGSYAPDPLSVFMCRKL